MNEYEMIDLLCEGLTVTEADEDQIESFFSFTEASFLTNDVGFVVRTKEGEEFHIIVQKS